MGRLAVVGGHTLVGTPWGTASTRHDVAVDGTAVTWFDAGSHVVLHRHGVDDYTPAHRVDHTAHVRALLDAGCDRVLALSSVGALHVDTAVGTLVVPHDFVALHGPVAAYHDARSHIVPAFDAKWRAQVLDAVRTESPTVVDGGVYWESTGPRFETPAEVRMLAQFADLVGMTAASEAVVAQEVGLRYAVLCVVDNLANGLRADPLTFDEFEAGKGATGPAVLALLDAVVPILA